MESLNSGQKTGLYYAGPKELQSYMGESSVGDGVVLEVKKLCND